MHIFTTNKLCLQVLAGGHVWVRHILRQVEELQIKRQRPEHLNWHITSLRESFCLVDSPACCCCACAITPAADMFKAGNQSQHNWVPVILSFALFVHHISSLLILLNGWSEIKSHLSIWKQAESHENPFRFMYGGPWAVYLCIPLPPFFQNLILQIFQTNWTVRRYSLENWN